MDKIAMNKFEKEYITGRKDQFDIDYAIFMKCFEETGTRDDLVNKFEEKLKYIIPMVAYEKANELMEDGELT